MASKFTGKVTVVAAAVLMLPAVLFAEDSECVKGQYVMSVSTDALKAKAEEALEAVSSEDLNVIEEAPASDTILLETDSETNDVDRSEIEIIDFDKKKDLCEKMERKRRADLQRETEEGKVSVKTRRRFDCSCNGVLYTSLVPNDVKFPQLWGLHQQNNIDINAPEAWDTWRGSANTIVAVIDSGVDYNHPDLNGNMWVNPQEIAGNGIDDDHNGYVDDIHGINAITGSGDPMDDHDHGTHCAGTIGGHGNNSQGVTGVNWRIQMIGVKFLNSAGSGVLYDAVKAIDYVTALKTRGENIVLTSNSWGGGGYYPALLDSIRRSRDRGLLFVAAAGNNGTSNDTTARYPGNYDSDNIISVAAIDSAGALAGFSNYGVNTVDIAAPGVNILSTTRNAGYSFMSGTSMATPHVSGALALLASYRPDLTYLQLRDALYQNVIQMSNLTTKVATGGRLNLYGMVANVTPPNGTPVPTASPTTIPTAAPTMTPTIAPTATPTMTPTATATPGWYSVQGRVKTSSGTGIAGVKVTLSGEGGEFVVYSGPNGEFSFSSILGPKSYLLRGSLSGHTFQQRFIYLTANTNVDIEGQFNEFMLSGKVITNDKAPVEAVKILLNGDESSAVYTNAQGQFLFPVPVNFQYTLTAHDPRFNMNLSDLSGVILGDVSRTFVAKPR